MVDVAASRTSEQQEREQELSELNLKLKEAKERYARQTAQLSSLYPQIRELLGDAQGLRDMLRALEARIVDRRAQIASLEDQKRELLEAVQHLTAGKTFLAGKDQAHMVAALKKSNVELEAEHAKERSSREAVEIKAQAIELLKEENKRLLASLKRANAQDKKIRAAKLLEEEGFVKNRTELLFQLQEAHANAASNAVAVQSLQERAKSLEATIRRQAALLSEAKDKGTYQAQEVLVVQAENTMLRTEVEEARSQFIALEKEQKQATMRSTAMHPVHAVSAEDELAHLAGDLRRRMRARMTAVGSPDA